MTDDRSTVQLDPQAAVLFPDQTEKDIAAMKPQQKDPSEDKALDALYPSLVRVRDEKSAAQQLAKKNAAQDLLDDMKAKTTPAKAEGEDEGEDEGNTDTGDKPDMSELSPKAAELFADVTLPQGFELDIGAMEDFTSVADDLGLNAQSAAALVAYDLKRQEKAEMAAQSEHNELVCIQSRWQAPVNRFRRGFRAVDLGGSTIWAFPP